MTHTHTYVYIYIYILHRWLNVSHSYFLPSSMHNKVKVRPYAWLKSVNPLGRWPGEAVLQHASLVKTLGLVFLMYKEYKDRMLETGIEIESEPVSCVRSPCGEHHVAVPLSWQRSPPRIGRSLWQACNNFRRLTILEVNSLIEPRSSQFNAKSTRLTVAKFGA